MSTRHQQLEQTINGLNKTRNQAVIDQAQVATIDNTNALVNYMQGLVVDLEPLLTEAGLSLDGEAAGKVNALAIGAIALVGVHYESDPTIEDCAEFLFGPESSNVIDTLEFAGELSYCLQIVIQELEESPDKGKACINMAKTLLEKLASLFPYEA